MRNSLCGGGGSADPSRKLKPALPRAIDTRAQQAATNREPRPLDPRPGTRMEASHTPRLKVAAILPGPSMAARIYLFNEVQSHGTCPPDSSLTDTH